MLVNMLKAAVKMLDAPINKSNVECARTVLNEIIINLESNPKKLSPSAERGTVSPSDDEDLSQEALDAKNELMS